MPDLELHCPKCGSTQVEDDGSVFVEDGPYQGSRYANEHDAARYLCKPCGCAFAILEPPLRCKCGERIVGDLDDTCVEDPENPDTFLCEECMKNKCHYCNAPIAKEEVRYAINGGPPVECRACHEKEAD
jgi:hypothetical protein